MWKGLIAVTALGFMFLFPGYGTEEGVDLVAKKRAVVYISVEGYRELDFGRFTTKTGKTRKRRRRRRSKPPVVKMPWGALGTGFFVSEDGYIVTAAHVINRPEDIKDFKIKVEVWGFPGLVIEPEVIYENHTFDIAVLKIKGSNFKHFKFSDEPGLGEVVFAMGHPRGLKWSVFRTAISNKGFADFGTVGDINGSQISHWLYQLEEPIPRGISGGVVFNKEGELICMPHASYLSDDGMTNFCVPGSEIKRVLKFIGVQ